MAKHSSKEAKRALWMREFERAVIARASKYVGRIDWSSATYFFNARFDPILAAEKYVFNRIDLTV